MENLQETHSQNGELTDKNPTIDTQLSNSIMLCIEAESLFKLYSYRIITPEVFKTELNNLIKKTQ